MPSSQLPAPAQALSTGLGNFQWIAKVRDIMEDWPEYKLNTKTGDSVSGTRAANAAPWKTASFPINDTDALGATFTPLVTVNGVAQTVIASGTPSAGQVLIYYDTGELVFGTVPGAVTVNIGYYAVRWRDQKILDALLEGLHRMWSATGGILGRYYTDTTIQNQVLQWEFQLPVWAQNPESRILSVEVRDPDISTLPFISLQGRWQRSEPSTIHIYGAQDFSPSARYKIYGFGPYVELKDLPPQYFDLPIWFAAGSLLTKKDAPRARTDAMAAQATEGAAKVGDQAALGQTYLNMFDEAMQNIRGSKTKPIGYRLHLISSYGRRDSF